MIDVALLTSFVVGVGVVCVDCVDCIFDLVGLLDELHYSTLLRSSSCVRFVLMLMPISWEIFAEEMRDVSCPKRSGVYLCRDGYIK